MFLRKIIHLSLDSPNSRNCCSSIYYFLQHAVWYSATCMTSCVHFWTCESRSFRTVILVEGWRYVVSERMLMCLHLRPCMHAPIWDHACTSLECTASNVPIVSESTSTLFNAPWKSGPLKIWPPNCGSECTNYIQLISSSYVRTGSKVFSSKSIYYKRTSIIYRGHSLYNNQRRTNE